MSKNLRKCMRTMHHFCDADSPRIKKTILKEMSENPCYFDAIHEIINNIYLENLKIPPSSRKKVKKFLYILDGIHKHPKSKVKRRKLVIQSGGFIQFILPILGTLITDLISDAISKKSNTGSSESE